MTFEDKDLEEFQALYEEEFGEPVSAQEAGYMASRLITLYQSLTYPLPSEVAEYTDSNDGGRLDLGAGPNKANMAPTSEKVAL